MLGDPNILLNLQWNRLWKLRKAWMLRIVTILCNTCDVLALFISRTIKWGCRCSKLNNHFINGYEYQFFLYHRTVICGENTEQSRWFKFQVIESSVMKYIAIEVRTSARIGCCQRYRSMKNTNENLPMLLYWDKNKAYRYEKRNALVHMNIESIVEDLNLCEWELFEIDRGVAS